MTKNFRNISGKLIDPVTGVPFPDVANLDAALRKLTAAAVDGSGFAGGEVMFGNLMRTATVNDSGVAPSSDSGELLSVPTGLMADYTGAPPPDGPGTVAPEITAGAFVPPVALGHLALHYIQGRTEAGGGPINQALVYTNVDPTDPLATRPDLSGVEFDDFRFDADTALLAFVPVIAAGTQIGCTWRSDGGYKRTCFYTEPSGDATGVGVAITGIPLTIFPFSLGPPSTVLDFLKDVQVRVVEATGGAPTVGAFAFNDGSMLAIPVVATSAGIPHPAMGQATGTVRSDPLGASLLVGYGGGATADLFVESYQVLMRRRSFPTA